MFSKKSTLKYTNLTQNLKFKKKRHIKFKTWLSYKI